MDQFAVVDHLQAALFGKVIKGMEAVNAIRAVKTGRMGPFGDVPAEPVTIESVSVVGGR